MLHVYEMQDVIYSDRGVVGDVQSEPCLLLAIATTCRITASAPYADAMSRVLVCHESVVAMYESTRRDNLMTNSEEERFEVANLDFLFHVGWSL